MPCYLFIKVTFFKISFVYVMSFAELCHQT